MESILQYLDGGFGWLLRTSGEAAVVALLILLVQTLLRHRLEARWRYALWLILVVRLLIPWTPESPASIFNFLPTPSVEMLSSAVTQSAVQTVGPAASAGPPASITIAPPVPRLSRFTPLRVAFLLWLVGAVAFGAHVVFENVRFWRRLSKMGQAESSSGEAVLALLAQCKALVSVRAPIRLVATDAVTSPALFGCFRPRLLMPRTMVTAANFEQLRYTILHELAHLKRHDLLVNWLTTFLQVAHWFNPVLWYAFYRMRMDREPACDARALSYLHPDESVNYGQTLLDLLEKCRARRVPGMAGILEDRTQIKQRIKMIALFTRRSYRWSPLASLILGTIGILALTQPTSAKGIESRCWYPAFSKVYSLADGETLRLVPPPFIPERTKFIGKQDNSLNVFFCNGTEWGYMATCHVAKDIRGEFYITSWAPLKNLLASLTGNRLPLNAHHVSLCDFDLPDALAQLPVPPGDWVLDPKAPPTAVLKALEAILRDQWKRDVRLEQRDMERDVIVMSGEFGFTPLANATKPETVYFFADWTDRPSDITCRCNFFNMSAMESALEDYLQMPVIGETHGELKGVKYADSFLIEAEERQNPEIRNRVLTNLTKQTGLEFRIERRVLPIWTMSEGAAGSEPK